VNEALHHRPVVFITGTSSGFGLQASVALAKAGYHVVASMRNLERRYALDEASRAAGVEDHITCMQLDVTDSNRVESTIKEVINRFDRIDVLINNAGYAAGGFVEEIPLEEWRRQFETNFFGVVSVSKAVIPYMRERQKGKIINVSSISGSIGFPILAPYAASKFAVEGFSESLRLELLPFGIDVVLVKPGSFKTEIWSKGANSFQMKEDSPYFEKFQGMIGYIQSVGDIAADPEEVIQTLVKVCDLKKPNLRYPVGKGVRRGIFLKQIVPWSWIESMMERRYKKI
jgi:NAD(P)-dependent dehydrogenase (short-subunit alcohol dehydrogenase family)